MSRQHHATTPDIVTLIRNADEREIQQRLEEIYSEADALKILIRALRARNRNRAQPTTKEGTKR